jgi:hypothetical protein
VEGIAGYGRSIKGSLKKRAVEPREKKEREREKEWLPQRSG